jgi:hypothetical protein
VGIADGDAIRQFTRHALVKLKSLPLIKSSSASTATRFRLLKKAADFLVWLLSLSAV